MKLRNRKSYLNSLPEGKAPVSLLSRLIHWIYFLILIAVVIYFARYIYYRLSSIEGFGQVVVERVVLSAGYGGNISQLPIIEGQAVNQGDLLLQISSLKKCQKKENGNIYKLKLNTEMKQAKLNALRSKLKTINNEQIMHRALELNNRALNSTTNLQFDIKILANELNVQYKLLKALSENQQIDTGVAADCQDELISSPFESTVKRVLKENYEFVKKGEAVVIIQDKLAKVQIEGYLSKYDLKDIVLGNEVTIEFPDGEVGAGVINKIDASAYAFSEREWENYEPSDSRIRILLSPTDPQQATLWKQYDLLRVQIRGRLW